MTALSADETLIFLTTKTRINMSQKYIVKIKNGNLFFNSEKIDPLQLPVLLPDLQNLSQVKKEQLIDCSSGTYTHKVIKNKKTEEFTGCLGSQKADELLNSINKLKKSKLL